MPGPLYDPEPRKGQHGIQIGCMRESDNYVFAGKIRGGRLKLPAHKKVKQAPCKAQYMFQKITPEKFVQLCSQQGH